MASHFSATYTKLIIKFWSSCLPHRLSASLCTVNRMLPPHRWFLLTAFGAFKIARIRNNRRLVGDTVKGCLDGSILHQNQTFIDGHEERGFIGLLNQRQNPMLRATVTVCVQVLLPYPVIVMYYQPLDDRHLKLTRVPNYKADIITTTT